MRFEDQIVVQLGEEACQCELELVVLSDARAQSDVYRVDLGERDVFVFDERARLR